MLDDSSKSTATGKQTPKPTSEPRSTLAADQNWITFAYPKREHAALQDELEQAVLNTLRSGSYILGPEVDLFEHSLRIFTQSPCVVAVSSGTDALVCTLIGLGIGKNQEVIVPAFGFVAAAEAVVRVGAVPVFIDIEPDTLGPDPKEAAAACSSRTSAIIVMHLFGQAVDVDTITEAVTHPAAHTHVIEDAAQAIGTLFRGRHVGTFGTAGTFSFFPAKSLGAAGDAGAVITSDPQLANRIRRARVHGSSTTYEWNSTGGNYRMDALQASLLTVKLHSLEQRLCRRRSMGNILANLLASHNVKVLTGAKACVPSYAPFVVRTTQRNRILGMLRSRFVDARVHYPNTLPYSPAFHSYDQRSGTYPNAVQATEELLSLPCSPELHDDEFNRLLEIIDEVFGG